MTAQSASPNSASADADEHTLIACPFVYANGRACTGRVEAYKADLTWSADAAATWSFDFRPRSHYHVFCSEKGNHAGFRRQDPNALKFWFDTLPRQYSGFSNKQSRPERRPTAGAGRLRLAGEP